MCPSGPLTQREIIYKINNYQTNKNKGLIHRTLIMTIFHFKKSTYELL